MKVLEFTYTKANGDVSQRTIIEVGTPTKLLSGIDISELEAEDVVELADRYNKLQTQFAEARQAMYAEFDLKYNYRNFEPDRMTEITSEFI